MYTRLILQKKKLHAKKNAMQQLRSHRDLNSDRWIQSPEC